MGRQSKAHQRSINNLRGGSLRQRTTQPAKRPAEQPAEPTSRKKKARVCAEPNTDTTQASGPAAQGHASPNEIDSDIDMATTPSDLPRASDPAAGFRILDFDTCCAPEAHHTFGYRKERIGDWSTSNQDECCAEGSSSAVSSTVSQVTESASPSPVDERLPNTVVENTTSPSPALRPPPLVFPYGPPIPPGPCPQIFDPTAEGYQREPPTTDAAYAALLDIAEDLRPSRANEQGHLDPQLDPFRQTRIKGIESLLSLYADKRSCTYGHWEASSLHAAVTMQRGQYCARMLRKMARAYIADQSVLPVNPFGNWNETMLVDEDLCHNLDLFLQEHHSSNQGVDASSVLQYLTDPDVMEKHGITHKISLSTAQRYMKLMGFRFTKTPTGQYVDGHEREDVVFHREKIFVPKITELQKRMRIYDKDGKDITKDVHGKLAEGERPVKVWYHDESIFYAHNRTRRGWFHKNAAAKPRRKGEGASLMVADFISADDGWLVGQNGRRARRLLKPGKNRQGYFTTEDVVAQVREAIEILQEDFPDFDHVFVYDNATTHTKRAEDALSARKMPKWTPGQYKSGKRKGHWAPNFLVPVTVRDAQGRYVYCPDGSHQKEFVKMDGARFSDGRVHDLYWRSGLNAGQFKGMATLLIERGYDAEFIYGLRTECKGFRCEPGATECCCRRILFNEPDFAGVTSLLEAEITAHNMQLLFLPKFHCELNPIEQCWGFAKRLYRLAPESSQEKDLERNTLDALNAVPLLQIRRFCNRALRYVDAYAKGLNGREAQYAAKKYRGHRVIPSDYLVDFEKSGALENFHRLQSQ